MLFKSVAQQILKLQNCERVSRATDVFLCPHTFIAMYERSGRQLYLTHSHIREKFSL